MLFWALLLFVDSLMLGFNIHRLIEEPLSEHHIIFTFFWAVMAISSIFKLVEKAD